MIIWEKVTIQDSSAKFNLALNSDHSGLQLTDANNALANLSLNKLVTNDIKIASDSAGLEYLHNDNNFTFYSPIISKQIITAEQGVKGGNFWSTGDLTLTALGSNIDVWCHNQHVLNATGTRVNIKQPLSILNFASFDSNLSTLGSAETIVYGHLYAQSNVDVDGNISAQNFGPLQFPATFCLLFEPQVLLAGQAIFSGNSEQTDNNKKYRLKFKDSESARTWQYTYNTWHAFDSSEEWPPLDEWEGVFVEFTVDGGRNWSQSYQIWDSSTQLDDALIVPIPTSAVYAQYVAPVRFNGAVLLSRTNQLSLLVMNTSNPTSWIASMCWCNNYGYTASEYELNQGWKIVPAIKE